MADAGTDIEIDQHEIAHFDGSNSSDNVRIVNWTWGFVEGGNGVSLYGTEVSFAFASAGEIPVTLTVMDAEGNVATDTLIVRVRDITDPEADAGPDKVVDQHEDVTLDGSASSDNVGVVRWLWSFTYRGKEKRLEGSSAGVVFDAAGMFMVNLTVLDAEGNEGLATLTITVLDTEDPVPAPPNDLVVVVGEMVTLDGSGSMDNVGVVEWTWTYEVDGEVKVLNGSSVHHYFNNPGKYEVILTVKDAAGNSANGTFTVTVEDRLSPCWIVLPIVVVIIVVALYIYRRQKRTPMVSKGFEGDAGRVGGHGDRDLDAAELLPFDRMPQVFSMNSFSVGSMSTV